MNTKRKTPNSIRQSAKPAPAAISALPAWAVSQIAEAVASAPTPSDSIKAHLSVAQKLVRAKLAFLSIYDPDRGALAVAEVRGRADKTVAAAAPGQGPIGSAFASKAFAGEPHGHLAIPLMEEGHALGVLSIVGAREEAIPEIWEALGAHLVAAIEAAQLRDALQRRTRDLETAVAGLKSLERAREELLGNVSHELKSPLTTIKAYLAMARRDRLGDPEKQRRAFDICERNADRLLRLINDMLLITRLQGGRMELSDRPFGLRALAQEAAGMLAPMASGNGVEVRVERTGEVYVKGDRERLLQAAVHLIEHGILGAAGGKVTIHVEAEGGVACLRVSDNGPGIPPEELPFLFERFHHRAGGRQAGSGSGLELPIVRQIVQLHGGTIAVENAAGEGTQFVVELPLFAGAVSGEGREAPEPRDGTILLVEDDADCREVLAQVLESEGLAVQAVASGEEATRFLDGARPALVLLDLRLGGRDGRAVLQHIRACDRLAATPVFVISGAADSAAGFRYEGPERIDGFFEKPVNLPRLLDRIREVVRPASQASTGA